MIQWNTATIKSNIKLFTHFTTTNVPISTQVIAKMLKLSAKTNSHCDIKNPARQDTKLNKCNTQTI